MASLSILLLASTVAIPFQAFAEKPDNTKTPVVILFNDKVSPDKLDLIRSYGGEITRTYTIINGLAANLPPQAIQSLENNPSVISIDFDIEFHALELDANIRIGADQVWTHSTSPATGNGVRVAILDTGIDTDNQEFTGRIILCESEMGTAEPTCEDLNGHGTHVAGIVGATGVNNSAKGVAYDVSYLIDKVLDQSGSGYLSGVIDGIQWAVDNNAQVISMSLGTNGYYDQSADHCDSWYPSMTTAVDNAVASGVTVVAAAGNSGASGVGLPACISNTIAVAAVDDNDDIAYFSSIGGAVRHHGISAPGVAIYSSLPGNTYASWSGTSMATPVVAGTIALLLEGDVTLSPADVKEALFNTACTSSTSPSCSSIPDTPSTNYGYGRVNAIAAFDSILDYTGPPLPDADGDGYTSDVDCNDGDDTVYPEAPEIIDDGIDQDCNGLDKKEIHVHDLDSLISGKKNMNGEVTITVRDSNDASVEGVTVSYTWSGDVSGSSSCITDIDGQCAASKNTKLNTMIFTVDTLSMIGDPILGESHDGDSITIERGEGNDPGENDPGGNNGGWDCLVKPHPKKCP